MDKTLADYVRRISEELKKPHREETSQDRYPVLPEQPEGCDLPNNPYSEV